MHSKLLLLNCRRYVEIEADRMIAVTVRRREGCGDGRANGDRRVIQLRNAYRY